ncbi:MAG: RdgB/HAM1 family non-canonical purine NTP pyrophosphatase [Clostridia bacterium]|jgi:non-canonical purine NTP pyrophosphatase (RdgB/HAM1 family)|nr:RdgB/HAM1 family non-canonical purine NTP pyrophosphatase [Clostridia bacterium]
MMKKKTIVVASNNRGKIKEIKAILPDFEILSLKEAGIISNPDETEDTFEGNALIKAKDAKKFTQHMVIADDSGLEVYCLNYLPGVLSKRFYACINSSIIEDNQNSDSYDKLNTKALLKIMRNIKHENRDARFVSCVALIKEDGTHAVFCGECEGRILFESRGRLGFGYDPIFMPNGFNLSFAEMSEEQKNKISHRSAALNKLKEYLND